jgi:hypothetical protein
VAAPERAVLARWHACLQRLAGLPPEVTGGLLGPRLLADVSTAATGPPEAGDPIELRVVILWAAPAPSATLTDELARALHEGVPGARPAMSVLNPQSASPALVRTTLAGAHAVAAVVGYTELVIDHPDSPAVERQQALADWLDHARRHPGPDQVIIVVHSDAPRRTDPASRRDRIEQMVTARLGIDRSWAARGIVETGLGAIAPSAVTGLPPGQHGAAIPGVPALAERLLRGYRADLAQAHAAATLRQARYAVWYLHRRCADIRELSAATTSEVPVELRWIWLQALAGQQLADSVAAGLDVALAPAGPGTAEAAG